MHTVQRTYIIYHNFILTVSGKTEINFLHEQPTAFFAMHSVKLIHHHHQQHLVVQIMHINVL